MPAKPSSASAAKKKSGTMGRSDRDRERERREKDEEEELANAFRATSLGRHLGITEELVEGSGQPPGPDSQPCDGCMQPFAGTNRCSACESVFYCGRDCQFGHWSAGHKNECKLLKERNEEAAKRVLESFKKCRGWKSLDVTGAYKAAVRQGLHDKIREVLQLDIDELVQRYQSDQAVHICYVECVMKVLFRGYRAEGNNDSHLCVDGPRIKGYVQSHPDALDAWLQASVQLTRAATRRATWRKQHLHRMAHDAARDVWSGWCTVFTSPTASRAILMPFPSRDGPAGESAHQRRKRGETHVRKIVEAFAEALRLIGSVPDQSYDPGSEMETMSSMAAAKVLLRTREYGINVDVERILGLTGWMKKMFQLVHIPWSQKILENNGHFTAQEVNAIFARAAPELARP